LNNIYFEKQVNVLCIPKIKLNQRGKEVGTRAGILAQVIRVPL
jgi:hypothetical protein